MKTASKSVHPFGWNFVHKENRTQRLTDTHKNRHTHKETNCSQNITPPRFRGGVKNQLSIRTQHSHTASVIVSTPQKVALIDARKAIGMFKLEQINVPVIGMIENMAYFTPAELPDNKYYIFGKEGLKDLAEESGLPLLGQIPLVQSVREAGDAGRPAVLQETTPQAIAFNEFADNVVKEVAKRNQELDPTQKVEITNMDGCSTN